ncbi:hypothetical protein [[Eubacterium] hominis]|uniref:hypothetical protein n=1 Tax=[Eubacterium] hominis TaxID=2764325 RepID=UPI003A4E1FC5
MSKFKEIIKMLGNEYYGSIINRLLEINGIDSVYNKVNNKYPDNCLYEQNILDIEAIIDKYDKKILG